MDNCGVVNLGVVVRSGVGVVAMEVLAAVFVDLGFDGRVVCASDGDFFTPFAGGQSRLALCTHLGHLGEAYFVYLGLQCLGLVDMDFGGIGAVDEGEV